MNIKHENNITICTNSMLFVRCEDVKYKENVAHSYVHNNSTQTNRRENEKKILLRVRIEDSKKARTETEANEGGRAREGKIERELFRVRM